MKKLSNLEMKNISGGGTISGSLFSALAKGLDRKSVGRERV